MTDQALDHKKSVKSAEIGKNAVGGVFNFLIPYTPNNISSLPPELPDPQVSAVGILPSERDKVLMSLVHFESFWAGAVGIEASKFASSGWALKSNKPRVQERFQNILLNSTVGVLSGWIPFASAGFSSFANTGKWFVEVERYTKNRNSRIKALHNLPPNRCWITSDPEKPVVYLDRAGAYHELRSHQVMIFMDMPDPDEETINAPLSSGVRAYDSVLQLTALKNFLFEKISGRRPLSFYFIQGVNDDTIKTAIENAQYAADSKGVSAYMGAAISAIMGDTPLNLITIPLSEIPDGVDVEQIRKYAHLEYANALGEDPTRIDPQLIGNRQLGAGSQARILDLKTRQGGALVMLKQNFTHEILQLLRDEKIQFAFEELDLSDDQARADVSKTRAETRKTQIDSGEISTVQAANLAVDSGDLPPEFLAEDETIHDVISDSEQPTEKNQENKNNQRSPEDLIDTEKEIDPENDDELAGLIEDEYQGAQEIFERISNLA